jgi:hypothetical protein
LLNAQTDNDAKHGPTTPKVQQGHRSAVMDRRTTLEASGNPIAQKKILPILKNGAGSHSNSEMKQYSLERKRSYQISPDKKELNRLTT